MLEMKKKFIKYSNSLFIILTKLHEKGYNQIGSLLMIWDYNHYYKNKNN